MSLTAEQIDTYLQRKGAGCPKCGSDNTEGGSIDVIEGEARQEMVCNDCELEWTDVYALKGVET